MKKTLSLLLLLGAFLFVCACDNTNNFGYPGKVTFTNEGGIKIVNGEAIPYNIEIANYDGDGNSLSVNGANPKDTFTLKNEWLTVVMYTGEEPKMKLIAEPNQSKKTRVLYIMGDVTDDLFEIKVVQH